MKIRYIVCLSLVLLVACTQKGQEIVEIFVEKHLVKKVEPVNKSPYSDFSVEERSKFREMFWAIYDLEIAEVQKLLNEGYDPDRCLGEEGWESSNTLSVIARKFYNTYVRKNRNKVIPDPEPDVAILQVLINGGANINKWPYIWLRVMEYHNNLIEQILSSNTTTKEENEEEVIFFVNDANRLLAAFLKAGADPDKLGHPYPYSYEGMMAGITDEEAEEYFAKGTRAINEAIKKGIWWESQVDLLLQYTTLDEDSLKAAEESGDPAMIGKISRLWEAQERKTP
jgi:hypothetical protein